MTLSRLDFFQFTLVLGADRTTGHLTMSAIPMVFITVLEARIYEQGLLEISQLQRRARFRVLCMLVLMVVSETVIQNYGDTLQPINPHTHQCSLRFQDKNSIINKTQTNKETKQTYTHNIKLFSSAAGKGEG